MKIREGYMDFKGLKTYWRVAGESDGTKKPIIFLHGGPGSSHNYFEVLDGLAEEGRELVMYDQIGCGKSPAPGRTDLFNRDTWVEELIALRKELGIKECHILGQSWGGMLLLEYVCGEHPEGIKSIILSSTLPEVPLWDSELHRLVSELPQEMQDAIARAEATGNYNDPDYIAANDEYMLRHCAPKWTDKDPECLTRPKGSGREAYVTGWGENEYTPTGTLRGYNRTADLPNIKVPTLITNGIYDLCTPVVAKFMFDHIPGAKWEMFNHSRHMAFAEENEKYMKILSEWLAAND